MTMILKNSNGIDYEILELTQFKGADVDYYQDSWQNFMYGLLKSETGKTFIVASMVGADSWGHGRYYDDYETAKQVYDDLSKEYASL